MAINSILTFKSGNEEMKNEIANLRMIIFFSFKLYYLC